MYLIGYDSGTSSIKATLLDAESGKVRASVSYPPKEMPIISHQAGWAEQNPDDWWDNLKVATSKLLAESQVDPADIKAIGITYQMHGLVCVDRQLKPLRPSIIWCDSRAVGIGQQATDDIGPEQCQEMMLNHVGNFTAAKLAWVKANEPDIYTKIHKIMLPGDYLAMKLTGRVTTTKSGLSEGIFWDFKQSRLSDMVMEYFGFANDIIPDVFDTFAVHGELSKQAADELGLKAGTLLSYRAGDQPNNAFSLNVLNPGEIAATAGTSGVVYGVSDRADYDAKSRVNSFVHVNNTDELARYGVLLCVNGTGILNSWIKHNVAVGLDYQQMNDCASVVPVGSDGLVVLPYGNGSERTLENADMSAMINGLNFNIHGRNHLIRAAQEGIAFALNYGVDIMRNMGVQVQTVRAGRANMFLSDVFAKTFATVTDTVVELYDTDGSQGAARGAGVGAGIFKNNQEAFAGLDKVMQIAPDTNNQALYQQAYAKWYDALCSQLKFADV